MLLTMEMTDSSARVRWRCAEQHRPLASATAIVRDMPSEPFCRRRLRRALGGVAGARRSQRPQHQTEVVRRRRDPGARGGHPERHVVVLMQSDTESGHADGGADPRDAVGPGIGQFVHVGRLPSCLPAACDRHDAAPHHLGPKSREAETVAVPRVWPDHALSMPCDDLSQLPAASQSMKARPSNRRQARTDAGVRCPGVSRFGGHYEENRRIPALGGDLRARGSGRQRHVHPERRGQAVGALACRKRGHRRDAGPGRFPGGGRARRAAHPDGNRDGGLDDLGAHRAEEADDSAPARRARVFRPLHRVHAFCATSASKKISSISCSTRAKNAWLGRCCSLRATARKTSLRASCPSCRRRCSRK